MRSGLTLLLRPSLFSFRPRAHVVIGRNKIFQSSSKSVERIERKKSDCLNLPIIRYLYAFYCPCPLFRAWQFEILFLKGRESSVALEDRCRFRLSVAYVLVLLPLALLASGSKKNHRTPETTFSVSNSFDEICLRRQFIYPKVVTRENRRRRRREIGSNVFEQNTVLYVTAFERSVLLPLGYRSLGVLEKTNFL